jgi:hypothetical protein
MKRATSLLATLGLMSLSPRVFAQVAQIPNPPSPSDILGPTLISWSEQQQPQPLPDSGDQPSTAPTDPQTEQQPATATQHPSGAIVKDKDNADQSGSRQNPHK